MLKYNFVYELKLLLRSRWIQVLSLLLLILFGFSAFNGKQKLDKRNEIIQNAQQEVEENDQKMLALLDSVSQGMAVSVPRWQIPTSPVAVGNYYPRVAAMESQSMGFIATGQADLFTPFMKPKVYGDDYALNFTEMTSPVQLLFGSFDLAFVIVYLLPLLIIAFSYNVLSAERESGSLRLLVSQPINLRYWVLQKLGLRFFWLSLLVIVTLIIAFLTMDVAIGNELSAFFSLVALTIAYMLFWFALAFIINLWGSSSARNAVSMLGLWVLLVLLVPSVLNQFGASMYPMPSRTVMINEMRTKKIEVAKIQDEILDNYLRDHPEYALNDSTETRTFWHRYMASQKLVKEELEPIVSAYEVQLEKQQALTARFKWVSPPLTMQESLNALAGTSSADYNSYRKQVVAFAQTWREYLLPLLYNNQDFSKENVSDLPKFEFVLQSPAIGKAILPMVIISMVLFGLGLFVVRKMNGKRHSISI